jgi:hypothetical protein
MSFIFPSYCSFFMTTTPWPLSGLMNTNPLFLSDLRINPRENQAGLDTSMFQISPKVIFSGKLVLP